MAVGDFRFGYERIKGLMVTAELVVISIDDGTLKVLLAERDHAPFAGALSLPGAFIREDEDLESTAMDLRDEIGLYSARLEEIGVFSKPGRDPRGRYVASAFVAAVPYVELHHLVIINEGLCLVDAASGPGGDLVLSIGNLGIEPAFDHAEIIAAAIRRLGRTRDDSLVPFRFLPADFTLLDLQQVHEALRGKALDKPLFRKQVLARIFEDGSRLKPSRYQRSGKGRPATLYERVRETEEPETSPAPGPASAIRPRRTA